MSTEQLEYKVCELHMLDERMEIMDSKAEVPCMPFALVDKITAIGASLVARAEKALAELYTLVSRIWKLLHDDQRGIR